MKYISLFSGIGGFEAKNQDPICFCESDLTSNNILKKIYPNSKPVIDVNDFKSEKADIIVGGWPCQDITIAGRMKGLNGNRSRLFFCMIDIACESKAHTIVGENVPNLLRIKKGKDFKEVIKVLNDNGFNHIAWRTLNARDFGLPQSRKRLFIVASKYLEIAQSLHRKIEADDIYNNINSKMPKNKKSIDTFGFYWTGGHRRSICLSKGYVPALKVGSSTSKGTSPVGIFFKKCARKLMPNECLKLQGFHNFDLFKNLILGDIYRMAGNAVPKPMGNFVVESVLNPRPSDGLRVGFGDISPNGIIENGNTWKIEHRKYKKKNKLEEFLDISINECLSPQASAGFLTRLIRGNRVIPPKMFDVLYKQSLNRTKLIGTKIDSFKILHEEMDPMEYRDFIIKEYGNE